MSLLTPAQIAKLVGVPEATVREWMADGRIPFVGSPSGEAMIPLGGFQTCMSDLFDLESDLRALMGERP